MSFLEKKILVVDDHLGIRVFLQTLLEKEGYCVNLASDGLEALNLCQKDVPSLVLMDFKMPVLSGLDALKEIKKIKPKIPVIIMTAYSAEYTEKDFLTKGADSFLEKPFEIKILLDLIKKYMD